MKMNSQSKRAISLLALLQVSAVFLGVLASGIPRKMYQSMQRADSPWSPASLTFSNIYRTYGLLLVLVPIAWIIAMARGARRYGFLAEPRVIGTTGMIVFVFLVWLALVATLGPLLSGSLTMRL